MTPYERRALAEIAAWRRGLLEQHSRAWGSDSMVAVVDRARTVAAGVWRRVPLRQPVQNRFTSMVVGAQDVLADAAIRSLRPDAALSHYQRAGLVVTSVGELRELGLETLERAMPDVGGVYATALAAGGALSGLLTGAGAALTSVAAAPAAAAAAGSLATDVVTLIAGTARAVAHQGAFYGYDVRSTSERAFVTGVMAFGSLTNPVTQQAGLDRLTDLSSLLSAKPTLSDLQIDALTAVTAALLNRLAHRLADRKAAQAVPVAGAVVGGGLNWLYVRRVTTAARWLYRERFLMDRHGLHGRMPDSDVIDISDLLDED